MECKEKVKYATSTESRNKYKGENQDSGFAGRVILADGVIAYIACVADGVGSSEENKARIASLLTIYAFQDALRNTVASTFSTLNQIYEWADAWGEDLQEEVKNRAKYGLSTFSAIVLVPQFGNDNWNVISINIGDSSSFMVTNDSVVSMTPDAPSNYRNTDSNGALLRAIGQEKSFGQPHLFDISLQSIGALDRCWFFVITDGVEKFVNSALLKQISAECHFHLLPSVLLEKSLEESKTPLYSFEGKYDNATVSVLGFNVPERSNINSIQTKEKTNLFPQKRDKFFVMNCFLFILLILLLGFLIFSLMNNRKMHYREIPLENPIDILSVDHEKVKNNDINVFPKKNDFIEKNQDSNHNILELHDITGKMLIGK